MAPLPRAPAPSPRRMEGEIVIAHGGRDYRLRFDFNVMADFEDQTGGRDIITALSPAGDAPPSMVDLRRVFALCFAAYHPEVTLQEAGRIYSADTTVLERLMRRAMPEPVAAAPGGEPGGEPGNAPAAVRTA